MGWWKIISYFRQMNNVTQSKIFYLGAQALSRDKIKSGKFFEIFLLYCWSNYIRSSLALDLNSTSVIRKVPCEKSSNKWVKILKFWRIEMSYVQNKNRGGKVRLLGIATCPNVNDIMDIMCIKCTRSEQVYDF